MQGIQLISTEVPKIQTKSACLWALNKYSLCTQQLFSVILFKTNFIEQVPFSIYTVLGTILGNRDSKMRGSQPTICSLFYVSIHWGLHVLEHLLISGNFPTQVTDLRLSQDLTAPMSSSLVTVWCLDNEYFENLVL